jgi:broad specificity phosphatase PhoE
MNMDGYCQWRLSSSMGSSTRNNARLSVVQALVVLLCMSCATSVTCFQTKRKQSSIRVVTRVTPPRLSLLSSRRPSSSSLLAASSAQSDNAVEVIPKVQIVRDMPEPLPEKLKNHYYLLRHGLSTANVAGIISSARSLAYSDKHGLTDVGYQQGVASANELFRLLKQNSKPGEKVVFISSPFARARQTAQACIDGLLGQEEQTDGAITKELGLELSTDIVLNVGLMERYFGRLDNEAIYTYAYVWPLDKFNVTHTAFDVESVAAVCTRLRQVVEDLEATYTDSHIVWVSHADVLQIAQLYGAGAENVGTFSSYRFGNGEVRAMARTVDSLPGPVPLPPPQRGTKSLEK